MSPERPPALGARMLRRAAVAALVIVLSTAGAVSAGGLLTADELINVVEKEGRAPLAIPEEEIDRADAGEAQTIMLLGSDERFGDRERGLRPLSDTILLVRLDPDKPAIAVTSIPRDLQVQIPGVSFVTKINYAYSVGGVRRTLKTVKNLLSTPERPFKVNHVVTLGFSDFRRAVDHIGCVYVDIDRDYFNDNNPPVDSIGNYATIDVDPGYQKLCGRKSLDYVRYRHGDSDIVRAARQQGFIAAVRQQHRVRELLQWGARKEVARMVGRFLRTSASLRRKKDLFRILRLLIFTAGKPIQEVHFNSHSTPDNINVEASPDELRRTMDEFFNARTKAKAEVEAPTVRRDLAARRARRMRRQNARVPAGLAVARTEGEDQALLVAEKVRFPFFFPTLKASTASFPYSEPRVYTVRDELGKKHRAYRLVVYKGFVGEYYGVQGMTWRDPPILDNPSEIRIDPNTGRRLYLYYDGRRLRVVAWRTKRAVYWVSNTLTQSLTNKQMLAIAGSLRQLGG